MRLTRKAKAKHYLRCRTSLMHGSVTATPRANLRLNVDLFIASCYKKFYCDNLCHCWKVRHCGCGKPSLQQWKWNRYGVSIRPRLQKGAPCMGDASVEIFSNPSLGRARGIINDFNFRGLEAESGWEKFSLGLKDPFLSSVFTSPPKSPSIRDKTTVVEAIIPDLTPIKVIIVFFNL